MIIILEGPDGSGKTTLAKYLQSRHDFQYVHTGPPTDNDLLEEYGRTLYDACRSSRNVVIDRLHVGERIYGPQLRGQDRLGRDGEVLIHRLISAYGARLVFCLPPYEVALSNWKSRFAEGMELIEKEAIYQKVYAAYRATMNDVFYNAAVWFDYTRMSLDLAAAMASGINAFGMLPNGVIGSAMPTFLIVGEQANQDYLDLPFFSKSGSSKYLNDCLAEAGYQERSIALVNALTLDGSRMPLDEICSSIGELKVIALGTHAHSVLDFFRVKHVTVPHPSYWKRFHAGSREVYVKQLREIRIGALHNPR
jgi:hypothetical protein